MLPLDGIKILDLSQVGAGPYATSLLGDMGADVVKVEPLSGDPLRFIDEIFGQGDSAYFFGVNRSKRGIAVDLKTREGMEILHALLSDTDVIVVSMRPSALRNLRIDYASLRSDFPRLIYCSITAFGESGPRSDAPGMDILAQALGGLMGTTGEPDGAPMKTGPPVSDFVTTFVACFGILAALRARDTSGKGQKVSVSLLDATVALLANYVAPYTRSGVSIRPVGGGHPQVVPYQTFQTSDLWLVVACLTEAFWNGLCKALQRADLANDERFATNSDRVNNRGALVPILEDIFLQETADYWIELLERHDVPAARVNCFEDVLSDPQVISNGMILKIQHPKYGEFTTVNNPIKLSDTPAVPSRYPPSLGEHTIDVLTVLGYTPEHISELLELGVVR